MKTFILLVVITVFHTAMAVGGMVGAPSSVKDCNTTKYFEYMSFATEYIEAKTNSPYRMRAIECMNASKQIVSGVSTKITMKVASTECKKNAANANVGIEECNILSNHPQQVCTVKIWEQPWANRKEVTEFKCVNMKKST